MSENIISSPEHNKRRLIVSVLRFLQQDAEHSTPDKKESVEVAMQCLESAYDIDYNRDSCEFGDHEDLLTIFNRHVLLSCQKPSSQSIAQAEEFKIKGNDLMRKGQYQLALEQYTRAIDLNPDNAVYFCNRAAAYSRLENHENAIADCEEAVKLDPSYGKAYGRLGIAYSNLNMFGKAIDAYRRALNLDPTNSMYEENLKLAEERLLANSMSDDVPVDPASVDLNQFMNNPNLLNMASQMLNDPSVRNVMSGILHMGNEGGNPNIDALLQMGQQLAQQMQINNPGFVDNLRRQFSGETSATQPQSSDLGNQPNDKKDEPPGSNDNGNASA